MPVPAGGQDQGTRPDRARVRDYLFGGLDALAADRALVDRIEAALPPKPGGGSWYREAAAGARLFTARAVEHATRQGCTQVIDLGCGLPVPPRPVPWRRGEAVLRDVPAAARDGNERAVTACVDDSPDVIAQVRAVLAVPGKVAAAEADWRDPEAVLASPSLLEVIRMDRPTVFVLSMILQLMDADQARDLCAGYLGRAAPGSYLVAAVPQGRRDVTERIRDAWDGERWFHSPADVASFFGGTVLAEPGLAVAGSWRPGWQDSCAVPGAPVWALAGVGVKGLRAPPAPASRAPTGSPARPAGRTPRPPADHRP